MTQSSKYGNVFITNAGSGGTFAPSSVGIAASYTFNNDLTTGVNIQSTLKVNGSADINGDLKVQGRSITESLSRIEERLAILVPNARLEADWEELHQIRMQYVELERKLLEQQKIFDILKKP